MKNNKNGFTLAELLIVVAIIAALVAVSIPIFIGHLEKSKEATDAANIRSLYAQVMTLAMTSEKDVNIDGADSSLGTILLTQSQDNWQDETIKNSLASILNTESGNEEPKANCLAWVEYRKKEGKAYLKFSDSSHITNWAGAASIGLKVSSLLPSGKNSGIIYSTDSELTAEEQELISDIKTKLGITDDIAVYYGWSDYPKIKITVVNQSLQSSDYLNNSTYAQGTYAQRITYNPKTKEIIKVEEEYGKWGNNNGKVGFWGNSMNGKYPTKVLYTKE